MPAPTNDLTIVRLSESNFRIKCTRPITNEPIDLTAVPLLFIGKVKITDDDDDAIFALTIGDGLELDGEIDDNNEILVTIASELTESLPAAKATTLYCELLQTGANRKTFGQVTIPVLASVKQT